MIFYLNILIDLCLIFALWQLSGKQKGMWGKLRSMFKGYAKTTDDRLHSRLSKAMGNREKQYRQSAIAEKMAERAFNMASSANLGVIALQKALMQPRLMTKDQLNRNALAKKNIDELFSESEEVLNLLRPVSSDEELELIDKILDDKRRKQSNGEMKQ